MRKIGTAVFGIQCVFLTQNAIIQMTNQLQTIVYRNDIFDKSQNVQLFTQIAIT